MQRAFLLIFVVLGTPAATVGQTTPSESQTLQALLTEVRGLRHDLQVSLTRVQSAQILLSRLQIQQVAVTRASQHLDETRSKLAEVQLVQKTEAAKIADLQERLSEDPEHREDYQATLNRVQSDLTAATDLARQRQATQTEAEEQLQTEQDKLKKLETQLDELVKDLTTLGEQSNRVSR